VENVHIKCQMKSERPVSNANSEKSVKNLQK